MEHFLQHLRDGSPLVYLVLLVFFVVVGFFLLIKGGDWLAFGAVDLTRVLGVHPYVIGTSVVAMATSVPELFTSITAIFLGGEGLIIGNVVGSNIANVALVLGVATFAQPILTKGALPKWQTNYLCLVSFLFVIDAFLIW